MSLPIVLLTLLLQVPHPEVTPAKNISVEGLVLRVGTDEPVEDAVVTLAKAASDVEVSVTTDRRGRFVFQDLDAATYRLVFESSGYVRQEYGQRSLSGKGTPITLAQGQALKNIVVRLTPTGSVSGRILDDNKLPVAGTPVRLMRSSYNEEGQKMLLPSGSVRTDDRGEYQLYFVTPGRYYASAGTPSGPKSCWEFFAGSNEVREIYTSAYYPGVADLKVASVVDVKPAEEVRGVDMTLARTQLFRVRGRIIDSTTGQPPGNAELLLTGDYSSSCGFRYESTYQNGTFEFRDVAPGSHSLAASTDERSRRTDPVPVVVVNSDIDGIMLTLTPGTSISGRVRMEGLDSLDKAGVALGGVRSGGSSILKADGTFRIDNVLPGEYDVYVWPQQPSSYIKEARFGAADVLNEPLRIAGPESAALDILLSSAVGVIDGTATAGVQVVLAPDRLRHRHSLFRNVTADQNGHFSIADIVPGDYKLFAWDAIETYSWFDAEVLARYESRARSVHVDEKSKQTIEVRTLPSTP